MAKKVNFAYIPFEFFNFEKQTVTIGRFFVFVFFTNIQILMLDDLKMIATVICINC